MTDQAQIEWPREIWMAERQEHDQGVVSAVLSEFATVARFEGDKERDRDFHRYVDADIYESAEKYYESQLAAERTACRRLDDALRKKDLAMAELFRRLDAAGVDYSDLVS